MAWKAREKKEPLGKTWVEEILQWIPEGYTHEAVLEVLELPERTSVYEAAKRLGNGSGVTSPDTVPLCLWIVANWSHHFEQALWKTVSALGDRDMTCAIVGGDSCFGRWRKATASGLVLSHGICSST